MISLTREPVIRIASFPWATLKKACMLSFFSL